MLIATLPRGTAWDTEVYDELSPTPLTQLSSDKHRPTQDLTYLILFDYCTGHPKYGPKQLNYF